MQNERIMKTPYITLLSKKDSPSKSYLMLSELIDNSIASWQTLDNGKTLDIEITINNKERRIICLDNAAGMSAQELLDSVELNKETAGNHLNMFGVGLKNAAFWFGEDLTIISSNGQETNQTSVITSKIDDKTKPVKWKLENYPSSGDPDDRWTQILIDNIYPQKLITSPTEIKQLLSILSTKYSNYIKDGVFIKIKIINKMGDIVIPKSGDDKWFFLKSNSIKAQTIEEKYKKEFLKNLKQEFESSHEKILDGLLDKTIEKIANNEPLLYNYDLNFNGQKIKLKIGIIKQPSSGSDDVKSFKNSFGIAAYQSNRCIRIPGYNPIKFPTLDYTRTNIKRVFGSMALGHIFKPDSNKTDFVFGEDRDAFNKMIEKIGNDIIKVASAVKNTIGKTIAVKKGNNKQDQKKLTNELKARDAAIKWDNVKETNAYAHFVDVNGKKWKINIHEKDFLEEDNSFFIRAYRDQINEREIKIEFNINHSLWKPLINNVGKVQIKNVIYPLVMILGLSEIGIKEELLPTWFPKINNETNEILSVIQSLIKVGIKL